MIEAPPLRIAFTVYGQPAPAGSKRHVGNGRIVDSSRRSAPWKNLVAEYAAQAMETLAQGGRISAEDAVPHGEQVFLPARVSALLDGPLAVKMVFYVPRPKGHYSKGLGLTLAGGGPGQLVPSAPAWPTTRPDVLKLARAVEDACTGIIWRDDAQIVDEQLVKKYGEPARVEVTVMEA